MLAAMEDPFLCKSSTDLAKVLLVHLVKEVVELDSAVVCMKLPVLPQLGPTDQLHERDERVFGEVFEPAGAHPSCTVTNPVTRIQNSKLFKEQWYLFTTLLKKLFVRMS